MLRTILYYLTHIWNMKLKGRNEQTRKRNKQELTDPDIDTYKLLLYDSLYILHIKCVCLRKPIFNYNISKPIHA